MWLHDLNGFLRLSAALNYQLSAAAVGRESVLDTIMGGKPLQPAAKKLLMEALEYLQMAYAPKRRRLGPMAILHPLRATALLARTATELDVTDLLSMMLHDKLEDLTAEKYDREYWELIEQRFEKFLKRMDEQARWFLMERIEYLTKKKKDTYYTYIGRLVRQASNTPELIRVKLADRLDNTLDMRIEIQDPLEGVDFYQHIFQLFYVDSYKGYVPPLEHPAPAPLNGAQRMYELFKNVVALSLIRQQKAIGKDEVARRLFEAICHASIKEAQRVVMHVFGYHYKDVKEQHKLLEEVLDYCRRGGIHTVTDVDEKQRLDGFIIQRFDHPTSPIRRKQLESLYSDKELMVEGAIAFIVIFLSFINDPDFYLQGISPDGIRCQPKTQAVS
jgi:hypothetical protein